MKTICIIGLGISGMVSAKYCLQKGYKVIILEKQLDIGGVWLNKTYPGIQLQTTKYSYAFSDFPHKKKTNLYPNREELLKYFNEYCQKHNLKNHCKFGATVIKCLYDNNKWNIIFTQNNTLSQKITVDYLVVCSGIYNNKKKFFNYKNIIYPEKLKYLKNLKDKNIVIVGNGPTGCDVASFCSKYNKVTLLYRSERWIFQRYLWKSFSTHNFLCRFNMILANKLPKYIYIILIIIFYYFFYIIFHFRAPNRINVPFSVINRSNLVLNDSILDLICNKKIQYIKTKNLEIDDKFVKFNNKKIEYDYCISCIGYDTDLSFIDKDKIPKLYNNIIDLNLKNCAFIGFASSFNWIQVSELQIQWYINYIEKKIDNSLIYVNNKDYKYNDLAVNAYKYCDFLANQIGLKKKYSIYDINYWFKTVEFDFWNKNHY